MKPALEIGLRIGKRDQRALRRRVAARDHMDMGIDHAGHDGRIAQIDDLRAGGNLHRRADIGDAVAFHQHDLVVQHGAGAGIEQPSGTNGDDLVWGYEEFPRQLRMRGRACSTRHHGDEQCGQFALPTHEILP